MIRLIWYLIKLLDFSNDLDYELPLSYSDYMKWYDYLHRNAKVRFSSFLVFLSVRKITENEWPEFHDIFRRLTDTAKCIIWNTCGMFCLTQWKHTFFLFGVLATYRQTGEQIVMELSEYVGYEAKNNKTIGYTVSHPTRLFHAPQTRRGNIMGNGWIDFHKFSD